MRLFQPLVYFKRSASAHASTPPQKKKKQKNNLQICSLPSLDSLAKRPELLPEASRWPPAAESPAKGGTPNLRDNASHPPLGQHQLASMGPGATEPRGHCSLALGSAPLICVCLAPGVSFSSSPFRSLHKACANNGHEAARSIGSVSQCITCHGSFRASASCKMSLGLSTTSLHGASGRSRKSPDKTMLASTVARFPHPMSPTCPSLKCPPSK